VKIVDHLAPSLSIQSENDYLDSAIKEITSTGVYKDFEWEEVAQNFTQKTKQKELTRQLEKKYKDLKSRIKPYISEDLKQ